MKTVPGIDSAQRFKTESAAYSPSLAMYSVASESIFQDPYYLSVRGMGEWKVLIDQRFYRRNLFAGLDHAPGVGPGQLLIVADRDRPDHALPGMTWLEAVAIDKSTPFRGIVVVERGRSEAFEQANVGIYVPVTP